MNLKKLLLGTVLAACAASVASADSLEIESSGATTAVVNGTGTAMYTNSDFNGWNISITFGSSNSPSLSPYGLDMTALVSCNGACSNPLEIFFSDTNFSGPLGAGDLGTSYSATVSGSGGSTTETAWVDPTNTLFGQTATIGSIGPFTGTNSGTALGGPSVAGPYSLTIEDIFTAGANPVSFSTDAAVTATPEPSEALMLGMGLLSLLGLVRRKGFNIA